MLLTAEALRAQQRDSGRRGDAENGSQTGVNTTDMSQTVMH